MPFASRADATTFVRYFVKAMRDGSVEDGNRRLTYQGNQAPIWTHYGIVAVPVGRFDGYYYGKRVFSLDWDRKRITDHAYSSYSKSTAVTVWAYVEAASRYIFRGTGLHHSPGQFTRWTCIEGGKRETLASERFRQNVPWAKYDGSSWWFYWELYNETLVAEFNDSIMHLNHDQNWRYIQYDWNQDGKWTWRFIDDAAKRRFESRLKKRKAT